MPFVMSEEMSERTSEEIHEENRWLVSRGNFLVFFWSKCRKNTYKKTSWRISERNPWGIPGDIFKETDEQEHIL